MFVRLFRTTFEFVTRSNFAPVDETFYLDALLTVVKRTDAFCVSVWYIDRYTEIGESPPNWRTFDKFMKIALEGDLREIYDHLTDQPLFSQTGDATAP